jgi:RNA polymerase sigma-70 factor (ECF subfamily)
MSDQTEELQPILDRLVQGDLQAKAELITRSCERLRRLARKILRCEPRIARWEQTDDLLQTALMQLHRCLEEVKPESVKGFIGLAAQHMRWELVNLARHHYGPQGDAAHHASDVGEKREDGEARPLDEQDAGEAGPSTVSEWGTFHEKIKELPTEEKEIYDYLYYHELSQEETARRLGVTERTVQRRWRSARLNLARLLRGEPPKA